MGTTRQGSRCLAVVAGVLLVGLVAPGLAESVSGEKAPDKALRKQALDLNDITGSGPMQGKLLELMADKNATRKLLGVASGMVKEKPQPFNRTATLLLAMAAENVKDVDTSAVFYRLNALQARKVYSERGLAQAYVGLIQLYSDNKRFSDSEKVCKEFLDIEGEEDEALERLKPLVMRRMILAIAKQGSAERALKLVDDLIKTDARNWLHRALKAQVLREADRLEDAAKAYIDVIERIKKDGRLEKEEQNEFVDEYRYFLSGIYIDLNQVDKASEQLKALLSREPGNPTYNNDLGFIWADRGMNLPEAEKLIRRAIEEERKLKKKLKLDSEPDSAAYLDSLGWVLFKQGKAKESKPHLLQAVKQKDGQSIEIYDHLADVQMSLGEKDEAVATWKKGLEVVTPSKRDQKRKTEVEKKLRMHETR